jgi:hypothetical protein
LHPKSRAPAQQQAKQQDWETESVDATADFHSLILLIIDGIPIFYKNADDISQFTENSMHNLVIHLSKKKTSFIT